MHPERVLGMVLANGTAKRPLETLFRSNLSQPGFNLLKKAYDKSPELVSAPLDDAEGQSARSHARAARRLQSVSRRPQADIELYVDQVAEMDPRDPHRPHRKLRPLRCDRVATHDQSANTYPRGRARQHDPVAAAGAHAPAHTWKQFRHHPPWQHCPQMDLPDLVNLKIEKFLQEIGYGAEPSTAKKCSARIRLSSHSRSQLCPNTHSDQGKRQSVHCETSRPCSIAPVECAMTELTVDTGPLPRE